MFKKYFLIPFLIIFSYFIHLNWFNNIAVLTHGDWLPLNEESQASFINPPLIWSFQGLGNPSLSVSSYPLFLILGKLSIFTSYAIAQRLILFLPIVFFSIFSTHTLFSNYFKSSAALISGIAIYNLNTYFLLLQTGHLPLALAFSFAPLVIYLYQKTVVDKSLFWGVVCGLAGFILGSFEFRALYIAFLICGIFFVFHLLTLSRKLLNNKFKLFFYGVFPIFITILLNLYWFVPSLMTGSITSNSYFSRSLFGQQFSLITYPLTLFHPFWTNSSYESFLIQPIPWYAWITPLLFTITIYIRRKHKITLFFATVAIIGIFLTKHLNPPFGFIYQWLYNYLPGFNAFRESSKFYFLIMLGYAGTIASLIEYSSLRFTIGFKRIIPWSLLIMAVIPFFINSKPLITGEIGTLFVPRSMPSDYQVLNEYIFKDSDFYRTLWVPTQSRWGSYSNSHPIINISDLVYKYSETIFSEAIDSVKIEKMITQLINDDNFSKILNLAKIKYVIVPLRDIDNDDDFFVNYGENREKFIQILDEVPFLTRLDIGTKEVTIFKNNNFNKNELLKIYPELDFEIKMIEPTTININFDSIQSPVDLVFSQGYHPGWQLISNDEKVVIEKIIDTDFNQIFSNSFKIYPTDGENNNIELQLVFEPQLLMNKYIVVSLISFLACLSYLIIRIYKKQ